MKNIREAVRDVIAERILPWIERDGISKLVLPDQIGPADCAKPMKCPRTFNLRHREHEIGIGLTGKAPYCIANKTFIFAPGRIAFLPAGTAHGPGQKTWWRTRSLDLDQPSSVLWLTVYPFGVRVQVIHVVTGADAEETTHPYMLLDRHFSRLTACLLEEVQSRPPNYAGVGRPLLIEFMQRCLRAPSTASAVDVMHIPPRRLSRIHKSGSRRRSTSPVPSKVEGLTTGISVRAASKQPPARVQAAQEFIHSNYHIPVSLDDIADAADTNPDYLRRQFKAAVGVTPMQYLTNVRMEAAVELLLTDLKVADVGRFVGIEDPAYFSRLFSHVNGLSPVAHRRRMAKAARRPPADK